MLRDPHPLDAVRRLAAELAAQDLADALGELASDGAAPVAQAVRAARTLRRARAGSRRRTAVDVAADQVLMFAAQLEQLAAAATPKTKARSRPARNTRRDRLIAALVNVDPLMRQNRRELAHYLHELTGETMTPQAITSALHRLVEADYARPAEERLLKARPVGTQQPRY